MEAQARREGGAGGTDGPQNPQNPQSHQLAPSAPNAAALAAAAPEVRAVAAHPRAAAALKALEEASKGLLVISESDEPFLPFAWPSDVAGPFSPAALAARYGGGDEGGAATPGGCDGSRSSTSDADETPAFTVEPAAAWFERAARAAEAAGSADEAERMRELARVMARVLAAGPPPVAVRVGGVGRLAVFLVGAVRETTEGGGGQDQEQVVEEEEEEDLGVFPPGAQVVGLETAVVET